MRMRTLLAIVSLASGMPAVGNEAPSSEVAALVEQLGSRDYKTREKAFAALKAKGPAALPAMQVALVASASPEVQRRLEQLIERQRLEQMTSATRVTISAKNQPVRLILKDICKQAGYTLTESIGNGQKSSLELKNAPFWEAIELATAGHGITATFQDDDRQTLNAYLSYQVNPHVDHSGPFRFVASNINASRSIQLGNIPLRNGFQQQNEYLNLNVMLHGEPKAPVVMVGTTTVVEAVDDLGSSLAPAKTDGQFLPETRFYNGGMYRSFNQNFSLNLARGDRRATMIKEVSGRVNLLLLSETRPEMELDNVMAPGKKQAQGDLIEIEVSEFKAANGGYAAHFIIKSRKKTESEYGWWNNIYQRLELHDEKGEKFLANGIEEQTVSNGQVGLKVHYLPPDGKVLEKPRKFVLMEWVTVEKSFEFKYKNVPLP